MKNLAGLVLFIFIVAISADLGSATKCYNCISTKGEGKDCESHVEKIESLECIDPTGYCLTVVVKNLLTRTCAMANQCDLFKETSSYCRVCNSDLCNTDSGAFAPSYFSSLVVSLGLFSLMKIFM